MVKLVGLLGAGLQWFDALELHDPKVAQLLCKLIPARCPLREKSSSLTTLYFIFHPCASWTLSTSKWLAYASRLSYLADECGEDVAILLTARRNERTHLRISSKLSSTEEITSPASLDSGEANQWTPISPLKQHFSSWQWPMWPQWCSNY